MSFKVKGWKKSRMRLLNKGKLWINSSNGDYWVGVAKNPDKTFTVMKSIGLQPKPFKKEAEALREAKHYMQENK
jgi:hypothetical protein